MNEGCGDCVLEGVGLKFREIIEREGLSDVEVSVLVKALTAEEAIGKPGRRDFPILEGKERVIEARVLGWRGHAFTDSPVDFTGKLGEIVGLRLLSNSERAVYIATLNAVLGYLALAEKTVHCKDEEPEKCAKEMASYILERWGKVRVGLIGLNPAIAAELVSVFGTERVKITDLNPQNIGSAFAKATADKSVNDGVEIWDGSERGEDLVRQSDVVVITGTTLVNGTFDSIMEWVRAYSKDYLIYGVTAAGVCGLMGLERICPYGRDGQGL